MSTHKEKLSEFLDVRTNINTQVDIFLEQKSRLTVGNCSQTSVCKWVQFPEFLLGLDECCPQEKFNYNLDIVKKE